MDIPALVQQLLISFGDKQETLAEALKVSQPTISRWLAGADPKGEHRDRLLGLAKKRGVLAEAATPRRVPGAPRFTAVPLISWVSAGQLTEPGMEVPAADAPKIAISGLGDGEYFALKVQGTSMDRYSPDKSVIVVNRSERALQDGKPYVFAVRGETTYKLWRASPARLEPYSTDPSHEPIYLDRKQTALVIGRVRRSILEL